MPTIPIIRSTVSRWHFPVFLLSCFSSIVLLLGHLRGDAPMHLLALWLGVPGAILMVTSWLRAKAVADHDFLLRLRAGFWGGILGTVGYDIVRIPIHYLGLNPLTPIRFYGVWMTGAAETTVLTDLAGIAYHFSNGLTFAWIFSLLFLRRSWWWGVAWGLLLEVFAVVTVFGEVFALRHASTTLFIAFAAHLFYGAPLGWVCQKPEAALGWFHPLFRRGAAWLSLMAFAGIAIWFPVAWPAALPLEERGDASRIIVTDQGLLPGMQDLERETKLHLSNRTEREQTLVWRFPDPSGKGRSVSYKLAAGKGIDVIVTEPGVHQILVPESKWRSVFVTVHGQQGYRPESTTGNSQSP